VNVRDDDTATLRAAMVEQLRHEMREIRSDAVASAFLTVPRYLFAPGVPVELAYHADTAVWRPKRGAVPRADRYSAADPATDATDVHPVVAFMARDVVLVTRLLTDHVADRSGRCRACGDQVRGALPTWPCPLRVLAAEAWDRLPTAERLTDAPGHTGKPGGRAG
jgi:hypothetical protein